MRLGGRHNMALPHLDFWPFDLEVGVGVACDLGYPYAKFHLPRPFGFRVRADVRDIRQQTDGRTDRRRMPITASCPRLPPLRGGGITIIIIISLCFFAAENPVERYLLSNHPCTTYSIIFTHTDFDFGGDHNTTFYVYLYNFRAPFLLQVNTLAVMLFA